MLRGSGGFVTKNADNPPQAQQRPGALEQNEAELDLYHRNGREYRRPYKVNNLVGEARGIGPTDLVGGVPREQEERPNYRDHL